MKKLIYFREDKKQLLEKAEEFARTHKDISSGSLSGLITAALEFFLINNNMGADNTFYPSTPQLIEITENNELKKVVFYGYLLAHEEKNGSCDKKSYIFAYLTENQQIAIYEKILIEGREECFLNVYKEVKDVPETYSSIMEIVKRKLMYTEADYLKI